MARRKEPRDRCYTILVDGEAVRVYVQEKPKPSEIRYLAALVRAAEAQFGTRAARDPELIRGDQKQLEPFEQGAKRSRAIRDGTRPVPEWPKEPVVKKPQQKKRKR